MTIKEQLDQNGYDTTNLFMPEEYDNAFLGLAITDWHYNRPVYDLSKIPELNIDIPDGFKEPIFVTKISDINGYNSEDYIRFLPDGLDESIFGITDNGQVVYEYEDLLECMMAVEEWDSETAADWISFNTLRDYSYRDAGPVVYQNLDHMLD